MQRAIRTRERVGADESVQISAPHKSRIAAVHRSPASLLNLPKLAIPAEVGFDRTERDYARLLLLFWEEGIKPKKAGPVLAMANQVISQWIKPQVKDLAAVAQWSAHVGTFSEYSFESRETMTGPLRIGISLDIARGRFMEKHLGKIEAGTKELGEAAIFWITRASYRTLDAFTPATAHSAAEYIWWQGESNEAEWKEMLETEGYDQESIDGLIGPDKFKAAFPEWVLNPQKKDLASLAPKSREGKKVLEILREMEAIDDESGPMLPWVLPDEHDRVYWGAYLGWKEEGCAVFRLLDDHFEMANQGGDYLTELHGVEDIPLEAEAFKKWKCRMEKGFRMLNLLDQLILLTSEEF